jgi:catechol 2,3-dioxygenase-like lactoylglutathione lyase family enzyme
VLHHVALEVPPDEADRSVEFWRLLGFEEVDSPEPLGDAVRWLESDRTQIHPILTEGHTAPVLGHAAVVASDHAEAKERLRNARFQVEDTRRLWGADRAFAIAPGGHRVELMAAPPRAKPESRQATNVPGPPST